jgi:hypothetical protein
MRQIIKSKRATRPSARVQICKVDKRGKVLEVNDALAIDKLHIKIVSYGTDGRATEDVEAWLDRAEAKTLAKLILAGRLEQVLLPASSIEQLRKGAKTEVYACHKGSERDGVTQARVLTLTMDPGGKTPYLLAIRNGEGAVMGAGAVKMTKVVSDLFVPLTKLELATVASELLDYTRDWEVRSFQSRQEDMTIEIVPMTCDPGVREPVQRRAA